MSARKKYIVATQCFTYNQASYIRETLNGFSLQETNFPVVFIIVDDASTDNEQKIITEWARENLLFDDDSYDREESYGSILFARHKEKQNSFFSFLLLNHNLYKEPQLKLSYIAEWCDSLYIAFCEGDDCWTDPRKLQKQVEYLEAHPDYSLVHTAFSFINEKGDIIPAPPIPLYTNLKNRIRDGYVWQYHLIHGTFILLCTCMYRSSGIDIDRGGVDHAVFMSCARQGKIHYIEDNTASYRIVQTGLMRSNQGYIRRAIKNSIFTQLFYYSIPSKRTERFYRWDLKTRLFISEAILVTLKDFSSISIHNKWRKLLVIIFCRPVNLLLLPFALIHIIVRRLKVETL